MEYEVVLHVQAYLMMKTVQFPKRKLWRTKKMNSSSRTEIYFNTLYRGKKWYICLLQLGWHTVAVVQYTFIHKQYTEQHNETEYLERNIHNNKNA
jgi:hypothetical protein